MAACLYFIIYFSYGDMRYGAMRHRYDQSDYKVKPGKTSIDAECERWRALACVSLFFDAAHISWAISRNVSASETKLHWEVCVLELIALT